MIKFVVIIVGLPIATFAIYKLLKAKRQKRKLNDKRFNLKQRKY